MTDIEKLRAFVRGYWEQADHETKKGEPSPWWIDENGWRHTTKDAIDLFSNYWYERGIKDLAEMVLAKLGEKE